MGSTVAVVALTTASVTASTSAVGDQRPVPTVREPAVVMPSRDVATRVVAAQQDRLLGQAAVYAEARRTNAEAVALAAVHAADAASVVTDATAAEELRVSLAASRNALHELAAGTPRDGAVRIGIAAGHRAHAPLVDWDAPVVVAPVEPVTEDDVMADLVAAGVLETAAAEVYAIAFEVELTSSSATSGVPTFDAVTLLDLQTAAVTAEALATEVAALPELEQIVVDPRLAWTESEGSERAFDRALPYFSRLSPVNRTPFSNGAFPLDALCAPLAAPGELLECEAAAAFDLLAAAYLAETGRPLGLVSSYRSYERQVQVKALRGGLAATPGTSNHGFGLAIDVAEAGEVGEFDEPVYLWLKENAAAFGWNHPHYMEPGGSGPQEPWHWEYVG